MSRTTHQPYSSSAFILWVLCIQCVVPFCIECGLESFVLLNIDVQCIGFVV